MRDRVISLTRLFKRCAKPQPPSPRSSFHVWSSGLMPNYSVAQTIGARHSRRVTRLKLELRTRKRPAKWWIVASFLLFTDLLMVAPAQENIITVDDLVRSAEQWAKENLDENALRVLQNADRQNLEELLVRLQHDFQGEYVIDLASLKESAKSLLPVLEQYEETLPYALWLKTRLDYFEVAEEVRVRISPPKPQQGQHRPKPPKPSPPLDR